MTSTSPTPISANDKAGAIAEIARLMQQYEIEVSDLSAVQTETSSNIMTRILAYLGGTLVIAGLSFYLAMQWAHFDSLLRVSLTLGPGLIAAISAITVSRQEHKREHLIATPLFILAALLETSGLFIFLREYGEGNDFTLAALMIFTAMAVQFLTFFGITRKPAPLLFTLIFAHFAFAALFEKAGVPNRYAALVLSTSGIMISAYLFKTRFAPITPLGFLFGGFSLMSSLFLIFEHTPYDIFLIGTAVLMIYASTILHSRTLLFVGVFSMLACLGYYTDRYFKDVVGWPLALMAIGIIMIVASSYAIRIGRKFKSV